MSNRYKSDYSSSEWGQTPGGQKNIVRVQDRQRAAVCCAAVYQEAEVAKDIFAKYNDLNFGRVILAPGLTRQRPRILVATAYDFCNNVLTTYVAFKGSSALETVFDVADSQLQCQGPDGPVSMEGRIHNGFHKALTEELPCPMDLLGFCTNMVPGSQMDRLIFCGHGLGGALSHVSMLSLLFSLANNTEDLKKLDDINGLLSIAFGAPLFLDGDARDYFSPVENRFLTCINDEDPVPLMLNKLIACPGQPMLENQHKKLNSNFQTILEIAGKVPILLEKKDMLNGSGSSSRRMTATKLNIPALRQLEETDADMRELKAIEWQCGRGYAAFGQFTRLSGPGLKSPVSPSDLDTWTLSWTQESVKAVLQRWMKLFLLSSVVSNKETVNRAKLEVVGYNLGLCLRKKCVVSDFADKWEITWVEQNRIVFRNKIKLRKGEVSVLEKQMTRVKVETMFGVTDWIQVRRKASGKDSHVIDGLKHVIGKLVIFYTVQDWGPGGPSYERLDKLKHHLQVVAGVSQAQPCLKTFFSSLKDPTKSVFGKRQDADAFIEQVSNHLHQSTLKVKLQPIIGSGEKRKFIVRTGLGGLGFGITMGGALAVILSIPIIGIPIAAGGLLLGVAAHVLSRRKEVKLEDYDQIIKFIYGLLHPDQALLPGDKRVADYEKAIIEKVKILSSSNPNAWIEQLKHNLGNQSKQTVLNFITLMLEIDKAVKVAKEQKVLAVVGPENVAKSTLINILRNGAPRDEDEDEEEKSDAATTGFTTHTDDPKGYLAMAVGNLVAVDFPGMGAAHDRRSLSTMWEAFERLPDLCLVLMKFTGDVTADCADVPKRVRKKLCDKIVLVVNHVDGIMKGKKTGKIWKEYPLEKVEELRQAFIRNSDNMLDSVMLTSLSRNLHDVEKEMLKERGILFAQDVVDQVTRLV